ncbi:MAG: hypothetical protein JXA73_24585 [Acidobacteria bacterium]|nr:hypothetical protein [Acidobacteriota bacterium]
MGLKELSKENRANPFSYPLIVTLILKVAFPLMWILGLASSAPAERLPTVVTVESHLVDQIRRMIQAGHLAPGLSFSEEQYAFSSYHGFELDDYWHNPGELIYTLAISIPYLPDDLKPSAKAYIESEFNRFPPHTYVHTGPEGVLRETTPRPPEFSGAWAQYFYQRTASAMEATDWGTDATAPPWRFPPFNIYACWKYAELFPEKAPAILDKLRNRVGGPPALDEYHATHPSVLNNYIAGYYGFLNLQTLAGEARSAQVENWLAEALQKRLTALYQDPVSLPGAEAGGFIALVPELGDYLYSIALDRVEQVLAYQNWAAPYWHIARAEEITRRDTQRRYWEGYHSHIYETASQFLARAYALKWSREKLEKYLDAPSVYRGDLTYIQNLVATLQARSTTVPPGNLRIVPAQAR